MAGPQWCELVSALRASEPVEPACFARLLAGIAHADGLMRPDTGIPQLVQRIQACPSQVVTLCDALGLCTNDAGYAPAAAQGALLEAFGGARLACTAHALAQSLREAWAFCRPPLFPAPVAAVAAGFGGEADAQRRPPADPRTPCWRALDAVELRAELRRPVPTIQDIPVFIIMRDALAAALTLALRAIQFAGDHGFARNSPEALRPWELFTLVPRMLLARCEQRGRAGRTKLLEGDVGSADGSCTSTPCTAPPPDVVSLQPGSLPSLSPRAIATALRDARRGAAPCKPVRHAGGAPQNFFAAKRGLRRAVGAFRHRGGRTGTDDGVAQACGRRARDCHGRRFPPPRVASARAPLGAHL